MTDDGGQLAPTPAPAPAPAIEAIGVTKSYGQVRALRSASFEALPGEVTALVGDNGPASRRW
jgi:simple sugar transport system ATP-binding protein